jgi:hypothetical protein
MLVSEPEASGLAQSMSETTQPDTGRNNPI